jgi:hypothetical protein
VSKDGRHAEQNLIAAHWTATLNAARESVERGEPTMVAVAINRAPCHLTCSPFLAGVLHDVDRSLKDRVRFVLAPTGTYEPTKHLTPEAMEARRQELREIANKLGKPGRAVILEWLKTVRMTSDTTTFNDLRRLSAAGWDIAQLLAVREEPTTRAGVPLAEATHKVAVDADKVEV